MSSHTLLINGRPVAAPQHAPAPDRKYCKFCRAVHRQELAVATCDYISNGRRCGAGICQRHSHQLGPDQSRCPLHDPDRNALYQEAA
jgi:hypothetical protein